MLTPAFKKDFQEKLVHLQSGNSSVYNRFAEAFQNEFPTLADAELLEDELKLEIAEVFLSRQDLDLYGKKRADLDTELQIARNKLQCRVGHIWRSIIHAAYKAVS